jgi:hypothetical protein
MRQKSASVVDKKAVCVSNLGNFPAIEEAIRIEAPAQEESKERR